MIYILDVNIISYAEDPESRFHKPVIEHIESKDETDRVGLSILSLYEYEYSIAYADDILATKLRETKKTLLELFEIFHLTMKSAEIFGKIKSKYRTETGISQKAIERHNVDFMIAASAIAENAILVSNDRIFEKIHNIYPGLLFENWTYPTSCMSDR